MRAIHVRPPMDTLRKKDRPPLPKTLPGEFFVLEWDKYRGRFVLHVDDEEHSSYDLGANIRVIMRQFKLWNYETVGNRAIDTAKEFGSAQAILHDGRVIALYDRGSTPSVWDKDKEREGAQAVLPRLSRY